MSTAAFLDQMLEPVTSVMSREFAESLLKLKADPTLQARVEDLRRKANEGTITVEEASEYKDFVEAVDVLSILQAMARQTLVRQAS
ncbi:MAG: hypothetical protein SGI77_19630 [Pirellulaceae bacterium]|nr:hypothetical protein [Pirellulaceae bacterium]